MNIVPDQRRYNHPWYLPDGLHPDGLLAAACDSPEALTAYVAQHLDQPALFRLLAESFTRMPTHDSSLQFSVFRPLLRAPTAEIRRSDEAVPCMEIWYSKLSSAETAALYSLPDMDACWSVSWPHVLLSLDKLLAPPKLEKSLSPESLDRVLHGQYVGWLGVLLLPTLRIYDPCAYECATSRLYFALYNNPLLFDAAFRLRDPLNDTITKATFAKVTSTNFDSFFATQPGLYEALAGVNGKRIKQLLSRCTDLGFLNEPGGRDSFGCAVKTQLLLTVPFLRSFPIDYAPVTDFLSSYAISVDVLRCKLQDEDGKTGLVLKTANSIDRIADNESDLNPRLRYLTLFQLITDTSAISLTKNHRFLNHIYAQLSKIFGYESPDSKKLRSTLLELFDGCFLSRYKDVYSEILCVAESSKTRLLSSAIEEKTPEILTKIMFTVSLSHFLSRYGASASPEDQRDRALDCLDFMDPTYSVLNSLVWADRFGIPCTEEYISPVLMNSQYSRKSKHYFSAYTLSLALTMYTWYNAARQYDPKFNFLNRELGSLAPLLQHVGVFTLSIAGKQVLEISVPRYVAFLTRMCKVPSVISAGIKNILAEYPSAKASACKLLPGADSDYRDRFSFLTDNVLRDHILSSEIREMPMPEMREESLFARVEKSSDYLSPDTIELCVWLFGVQVDDMRTDLTYRFKHRPNDPKDPLSTENRGRKSKGRVRGAKTPYDVPFVIVTRNDTTKEVLYTKVYTIKVLRTKGLTFFGLPWKEFYRDYKATPPDPKCVYIRKRGGNAYIRPYMQFFEAMTSADSDMDFLKPDDTVDLNAERHILRPTVRVYISTPYLFAWDSLFPEESKIVYPLPYRLDIPGLKSFLRAFNHMSELDIRARAHKPKKAQLLKIPKITRVAYDKDKREHRLKAQADGKTWSPSDPRIHFTEDEDYFIYRNYRPKMTQETKDSIMRACPGHSWAVIGVRAKLLCEKLIEDGVTDLARLPHMYVTSRLKKLLSKEGV